MNVTKFRAFARALRQPLVVVGADGQVLVANPAAEQVLGPDVVGAPVCERVDDGEALGRLLDRAIGSAAPLPGGFTRAGERWRCDASRTLLEGQPAVLLQLTSQAAAARRFTALNQKIDELNAEIRRRRALETERAALLERERAARREAESVGRLKDEFLASLSHELRTPLQAISGWAAILRKRTDPTLVERAVATITRNVAAQNRLIEDLLDISRAARGGLNLTLDSCDLAGLLREVAETLKPTFDDAGVELRLSLPDGELVAAVDPDRMAQVVTNLLGNACRYTPAGGRATLSLKRLGDHVEIRCADTGQGIAPEFLPYVFDRFRQEDGSTTRRSGGLGLGLSIAGHLVELHGGLLIAESEGLDRGATFVITLPLPQFEPTAVVTSPPATVGGGELAGVRVVLVEDHADSRELLEAWLSLCGAEAACFPGAEPAREHLRSHPVDLMLSDLEMPGEDGFTMIRKLRAEEAAAGAPPVPAIALTAHTISRARQRAIDAGFDDFLPKPVDQDLLLARIKALLR